MSQTVYIFDVDGVLNDPKDYEIDDRIIAHIAMLLEKGVYVAINTGRGYAWAEEDIVQALRPKLKDTEPLARLFIAAEMGGLGVEFTDGAEQRMRSAFSLRPEQIAKVREIFEQHPEHAGTAHWYGKESMATIDKNHAASLAAFKHAQAAFTTLLTNAFKGEHVKVVNSNDAVDVHAPEAGKWAGAELIYEWLRRVTDIPHDRFVCFGDSVLDYEMARFFAEQSLSTTFVFTGPVFTGTAPHPGIQFVKTDQPYKEGAYQYLRALR